MDAAGSSGLSCLPVTGATWPAGGRLRPAHRDPFESPALASSAEYDGLTRSRSILLLEAPLRVVVSGAATLVIFGANSLLRGLEISCCRRAPSWVGLGDTAHQGVARACAGTTAIYSGISRGRGLRPAAAAPARGPRSGSLRPNPGCWRPSLVRWPPTS